MAVERVEGFATPTEVEAAYPEINAFEAQQQAHGTTLVKLFIHIRQDEQDERFRKRLEDPWKRWKTGADDYRNRAKRDEYLEGLRGHVRTHRHRRLSVDGDRRQR